MRNYVKELQTFGYLPSVHLDGQEPPGSTTDIVPAAPERGPVNYRLATDVVPVGSEPYLATHRYRQPVAPCPGYRSPNLLPWLVGLTTVNESKSLNRRHYYILTNRYIKYVSYHGTPPITATDPMVFRTRVVYPTSTILCKSILDLGLPVVASVQNRITLHHNLWTGF